MAVEFKDYSIQVIDALEERAILFLSEAAGEVESQTKRNSRVDSGQTKGSWQHVVDESKFEAVIGSPLENAIWEEFGTGEYALKGDGRKGGWVYINKYGKKVFTLGKRPNRALHNAFETLKSALIARAESIFRM